MKRTHLAGLTGLLALSGAGGYFVCGTSDCEDPGYLVVNVVQADGEGFKPARVPSLEYVVESDPRDDAPGERLAATPTSATCLDQDCTRWKVAPGDDGEIHVSTLACGKRFEEMTLVDRDDEGCNHGEREIDLIVDLTACGPEGADAPTDLASEQKNCTLEIRPSVQVYTWKKHDDYFSPASAESVKYVYKGGKKPLANQPPASCIDERCTSWNLGAEQAGLFEIEVSACGKTQLVRADVQADACHVLTERLDVVLEGIDCLTNEAPGDGSEPPKHEGNPGPDVGDKTVPPPAGPAGRLEKGCDPGEPQGLAFVAHTVKQHGDMLVPVGVETLHYTVDGAAQKHQAKCEGDPCSIWQGPGAGAGLYELMAPLCDETTTLSLRVPAGDKGCGVETQYLMWDVDRTNCLAAGEPSEGGGGPGGPGDK